MVHSESEKARLTGIDAVYIPVTNKDQSKQWFVEHFGLSVEGDHLLAGRQEIFLLECRQKQTLTFQTGDWVQEELHYEMPVICFQASDIIQLYEYTKKNHIQADELLDQRWFWEFNFIDPDGNKFKVWQPK
jgi:catechol 2,3-dioxygenase-like lactoylglutathione lyase family enzyme